MTQEDKIRSYGSDAMDIAEFLEGITNRTWATAEMVG